MTLATLLTTAFAAANSTKTDQGRLDRGFLMKGIISMDFLYKNMLFMITNKKVIFLFCLLPPKRSGVRKESVVETAAVFPNGL